MRRETRRYYKYFDSFENFNPLPPCGGRLSGLFRIIGARKFQSTPSVRRETGATDRPMTMFHVFQSTPSVRRETYLLLYRNTFHVDFNPLPPCGGRLLPALISQYLSCRFQSTPSVRRETVGHSLHHGDDRISIHSLRAEGDVDNDFSYLTRHIISIHSLRAEGDVQNGLDKSLMFYISIHSLRAEGDREPKKPPQSIHPISIHSLRAEGDEVS